MEGAKKIRKDAGKTFSPPDSSQGGKLWENKEMAKFIPD